ncbi:uspa1 [Plakobranchus ocellatus]|uniref:Uspa1 n=1 Tax=Plakobranchus ocellatus TaxID=259542 RepID=A0AAV3Z3H9_9GAST|nr:uspa1 [Plakobranchus ocellatus]
MTLQRPPRAKDLARKMDLVKHEHDTEDEVEGATKGGSYSKSGGGAENVAKVWSYGTSGGRAKNVTKVGSYGTPECGAKNVTKGGDYSTTGGGAENVAKVGSYETSGGGAKNVTKGGDYSTTAGGAENFVKGGVSHKVGNGAEDTTRNGAKNRTGDEADLDRNGVDEHKSNDETAKTNNNINCVSEIDTEGGIKRSENGVANMSGKVGVGTLCSYVSYSGDEKRKVNVNVNNGKSSADEKDANINMELNRNMVRTPGKYSYSGTGTNKSTSLQKNGPFPAKSIGESIRDEIYTDSCEEETRAEMIDVKSQAADALNIWLDAKATGSVYEHSGANMAKHDRANWLMSSESDEPSEIHYVDLKNGQKTIAYSSERPANYSSSEKLQALIEENTERHQGKASTVNSNSSRMKTKNVEMFTAEHCQAEQQKVSDSGLPVRRQDITSMMNGSDHTQPVTHNIRREDQRNDQDYLYECSPEFFAAPKVKFHLGGDEEVDDDTCGEWTCDDPQLMVPKENCPDEKFECPVFDSPQRQVAGRTGAPNLPNNVAVINRTSGMEQGSAEITMTIFDSEANDHKQYVASRSKKKVSIEEPRMRRFDEIEEELRGNSMVWSKPDPVNASIDRVGNNDSRSTKKQHLSPRHLICESPMRYRRRSQLSLSPDIPIDVPLKHRQLENEVRNKSNLEFIKRRVSLQEDQNVDINLNTELYHRQRSTVATPPPCRSFSTPGYYTHGLEGNARYAAPSEQKARRTGLGYAPFSNPGFSFSDLPSNNGNLRITKNTYEKKNLIESDNDRRILSRGEPERQGEESKTLDKSLAVQHSREGSNSSTVIIESDVDEAEIAEYLGNIHPYGRRYGFCPPGSRDLQQQLPDVRREVVSDRTQVTTRDDERVTSAAGDGKTDPSMEPYVPIRRQRISFQERRDDRLWSVRGQDNHAFQATQAEQWDSASQPLSKAPSADSVVSSVSSLVNSDQMNFPAGRIRKDSLAIFNSKLSGGGRGKLRRLSQISLDQLQHVTRKHVEESGDDVSSSGRPSPGRPDKRVRIEDTDQFLDSDRVAGQVKHHKSESHLTELSTTKDREHSEAITHPSEVRAQGGPSQSSGEHGPVLLSSQWSSSILSAWSEKAPAKKNQRWEFLRWSSWIEVKNVFIIIYIRIFKHQFK